MISLAKNVTVIPAKKKIGTQKATDKVQKTRVAAYCRVSTDSDEQESSYDTQIEHYTTYIESHPEWVLAGIYADDGISGMNTKKRDEFQRMISDCNDGKIDMIITKSISRFARNTVDCLNYTRALKNMNIGVYFEKENINTLDANGEVLMTIMASLAQQESESLSANVRLGLQFRYQQGKVQVNHNWFLGYTKDDDGHLIIDPEQAEVVKRIYREYLEGKSFLQIKRSLETDGIRNGAGNKKWHESNIKQILTNEKYIGDALLQKTYTVDILEKKREANKGQVPKYYVEDSHEPIIPKDIFLKVQEEIARRANLTKGITQRKRIYSGRYALSGIVFCSHCGDIFRRIKWNNRGCKSTVWRCVSRVEKDGPECTARTINEEWLHEIVIKAINEAFRGKETILPLLRENIESSLEKDTSNQIAAINEQMKLLQQELLATVNLINTGDEIGMEIRRLRDEQQALQNEQASRQDLKSRIDEMMSFLNNLPCELTEYEEEYVRTLLEKITVYDDHIIVEFKSGIEIQIEE
ncbi:DNA invertase Pin-like site-specific DNA recombinase [Anaerotaenia torta]|uniref:recombinase family protein n=1 Tax=Anaerotaenia torta TaxID=433293 RepID=UPI003D1E0DA7